MTDWLICVLALAAADPLWTLWWRIADADPVKRKTGLEREVCEMARDYAERVAREGGPYVEIRRPPTTPPPRYRCRPDGEGLRVTDHRRPALRAALAILMITAIGCATTAATPKTITNPKQLVGAWTGFVPCRECAMDFRTTLLIRDDATWTATVLQGSVHHGTLITESGVVSWGQGVRPIGPVIVVERGGREYMSLVRENGSVWGEFQRAR